ncbi:MAG: hypothetical protein U0R80_11405 [Nocardioidaceae bacterium]
MSSQAEQERLVADTERWFEAHGLPWFVDRTRRRVRASLGRARVLPWLGASAAVAVAVGVLAGRWQDAGSGVAAGLSVLVACGALYAVVALDGLAVLRWAARRTLGSLGLLLPLAARALPLLLLFMTFLFINTEVWQVASGLSGGVMWAATMIFAAMGLGFLLTRLPEELEVFDQELTRDRLVRSCADTPLASAVESESVSEEDVDRHSDVVGLERANLLLVLLVAQAIQVLLLSLSVWVFFVVFGAVAIHRDVIEAWTTHPPDYLVGDLVSRELIRVATFLAAFAGLYFTVYAVTDESYRKQFFTATTRELERAVSVRLVYRRLRDG